MIISKCLKLEVNGVQPRTDIRNDLNGVNQIERSFIYVTRNHCRGNDGN